MSTRDVEEASPDVLDGYTQTWSKRAEELRDRLVYLAADLAPSRARYEYLESRTAIGATKWKNVFLNRQMPTNEMLLAICHYRSQYAHWLMTGDTGSSDVGRSPTSEMWEKFETDREWERRKRGAKEK